MSEKRIWTRQELIDPLVGDFDTSPFPITLGVDGNEIIQSEFKALTPEQRLDSLYTTMAVNHARKSLGLESLYQLRINKNSAVITLTVENGKFLYNGLPEQRILLVVGKSYTINSPSGHPIALAEELDDNGQGFVEYTDGIIRNSPTSISVTPTIRTPNLYYYCTAHGNMGGEIGATNAYTFETVTVEGSDGPVDDYFIRWDPSQFARLVVSDVAIDLASLELDSDSQVRQTYLSFIPQIDPLNDDAFDSSVDVQNFKNSIANDMVFLDQEDYLDLSGNTLLMKWTNEEEPIIQNEYEDALAMNSGPGHKPYTENLTVEQVAQIETGIDRYKDIISQGKLPASSYFNPPRKKANDNPAAFDVVETAPIAARSYLHQCYELCNWNEVYQPADGIFFDSIFLFLNIKDPAYGISAEDGSGCQDYMEPRQKVRIARVLTEKGIFSKRRNLRFTMEDQPRGSLFMGACVVSVPTAYVSPRYDIFPRFDMFCYGENNHKFENNPNLKYRVKHDLEQKDTSLSLTDEQLQDMSDNAVWSAVQELPSSFSQDHFKLRGTDGITKISVFKRDGVVNTSNVGYKSATFGAGSAQQTYWVLDPALTLNLDLFNHGIKRMFILDETGYDLNSVAQSFENLYSYKV